MRTLFLILFYSLSNTFLIAQNETEIFSLQYRSNNQAFIANDDYDVLNYISFANSVFAFNLDYGNVLKDTSIVALYSITYENISQNLNLSYVENISELDLLPKNYYQQPQFSLFSLTVGLSKYLAHDWSVSGFFTANITDDFFKPNLATNINIGGLAYVEKTPNNRLSYGVGMLFWQLENKIFISPALNFKYQNEKRGVEILFPNSIRLWQKINKESYLETSLINNFYSIVYQPDNEVTSTDINYFRPELTYNYLWGNFIKVSIGINMPFRIVALSAIEETIYYQQNSIGLSLGLSLVID